MSKASKGKKLGIVSITYKVGDKTHTMKPLEKSQEKSGNKIMGLGPEPPCQLGQKRCINGRVQRCVLDFDGEHIWMESDDETC